MTRAGETDDGAVGLDLMGKSHDDEDDDESQALGVLEGGLGRGEGSLPR